MSSFVAAIALMMLLWQTFDPRVFVFFAFFLAMAEIFLQIRWRLAVVCRMCGFDPVLYVRNPGVASAKVKARLEQRRQDPAALLGPAIRLPTLSPARAQEVRELEEQRQAKSGRLLSKSI